jgi:general stress protein 13
MPKYRVGDIIKCQVTGISPYGFFAKIDESYTGLCHISEMSYEYVPNISEFVHADEIIYAQIVEIDSIEHKMKLSIKDIYYKTENDGKIVESRKGFLPLKKMLPIWIKEKINTYKK